MTPELSHPRGSWTAPTSAPLLSLSSQRRTLVCLPSSPPTSVRAQEKSPSSFLGSWFSGLSPWSRRPHPIRPDRPKMGCQGFPRGYLEEGCSDAHLHWGRSSTAGATATPTPWVTPPRGPHSPARMPTSSACASRPRSHWLCPPQTPKGAHLRPAPLDPPWGERHWPCTQHWSAFIFHHDEKNLYILWFTIYPEPPPFAEPHLRGTLGGPVTFLTITTFPVHSSTALSRTDFRNSHPRAGVHGRGCSDHKQTHGGNT